MGRSYDIEQQVYDQLVGLGCKEVTDILCAVIKSLQRDMIPSLAVDEPKNFQDLADVVLAFRKARFGDS